MKKLKNENFTLEYTFPMDLGDGDILSKDVFKELEKEEIPVIDFINHGFLSSQFIELPNTKPLEKELNFDEIIRKCEKVILSKFNISEYIK